MADTTLNVRVVNNGTGGAGGTTPPVTPPNTPPSPQQPNINHPLYSGAINTVPANDRMIEDVRREMQQRGVLLVPGSSSMTQIINQYGRNLRDSSSVEIGRTYDARRANLRQMIDERKAGIIEAYNKDVADAREIHEMSAPTDRNGNVRRFEDTDTYQSLVSKRDKALSEAEKEYDSILSSLNKNEGEEKQSADRELVNAIKELTDYFKREAQTNPDKPDSYIGQLRAQQRALIQERDTATTKEGAQDASRRLATVNEQLREAMVSPQARPVYDSMLQGTQGLQNMIGGLESGDPASLIMGGAATYAGFSGMGFKAAMRVMGWAAVAAAVAKGITGSAKGYAESMEGAQRNIAALVGSPSSMNVERYINTNVTPGTNSNIAASPGDLGFTIDDFANIGLKAIRARGSSENWRRETYRAITSERAFGMDEGALINAMTYDRYGKPVTEAVNRLVVALDKLDVKGIKINKDGIGDFTRVQEVFDIQQQLMGGYMGITDKPDYNAANKLISAFSSIQGITQDKRLGSDIESFQGMIRNPMNDRVRALLYDVVQDIVPVYNEQKTSGRTDLIDQVLHDPKYEGKIIQQMVQRVANMFGGPDTQMGYWAFKQLLPGITPDRLVQEVNAILHNPETSQILRGEYWNFNNPTPDYTTQLNSNIARAKNLTTDVTGTITEIKNDLKELKDEAIRFFAD